MRPAASTAITLQSGADGVLTKLMESRGDTSPTVADESSRKRPAENA